MDGSGGVFSIEGSWYHHLLDVTRGNHVIVMHTVMHSLIMRMQTAGSPENQHKSSSLWVVRSSLNKKFLSIASSSKK